MWFVLLHVPFIIVCSNDVVQFCVFCWCLFLVIFLEHGVVEAYSVLQCIYVWFLLEMCVLSTVHKTNPLGTTTTTTTATTATTTTTLNPKPLQHIVDYCVNVNVVLTRYNITFVV